MHHVVPGTLCRRRARRVTRLAKGKDTGKDEARGEGVGYERRSARGELADSKKWDRPLSSIVGSWGLVAM